MKKIIISILCVMSFSAFAEDSINLTAEQIQNLGVELGRLQVIKSAPLFDAPAKVTIPPENDYIVSTLYAGLIKQIKAVVGDNVVKGQVLAIIQSPELLKLQQQHLKAVNDLKLSEAEFLRDQKLFKDGVISGRRWLKTETSHQVYQSYVNETEQLLMTVGFSKKNIKNLVRKQTISSELIIRSPIAGVVLFRQVKAGQKADALAPLFRVANLETLWLDISIPQQRVHEVKVGDQVDMLAYGVSAKLFLLGQNVDENTQTVLARAVVAGTPNTLRAGQVISVKISQSNNNLMYQVPSAAVTTSDGSSYIFVRSASGFVAKVIKIQGRDGNNIIVSGKLDKTSVIAIKGGVALKANLLGLGGDE